MENIKNFPRYERYKDSRVDWIGEIPEHWDIHRIKQIFHERVEKNDPIKTTDILSLSMHLGVTPYSEDRGGNKAKEDLTAYHLAYPNDIVVNSMNVIVGSVGLSKYFGAVSPVYHMLYLRSQVDDIHFYDAVFQNKGFQQGLIRLGNGILIKRSESSGKLNTIRMRIPMSKLAQVFLPHPPLPEQTAIAQFLDHKTAQIDRAIAIKEEQIKLLNERKQIMIQEAVTKGLDPTVPMKDSGVEWIGEIPESWKTKRLRYLGTIKSGDGITNSELKESGGYEVFGGNGFMGYSDKYNVSGDKIIIGRVGAYCGNVRYINEKKWISDNALILTLQLNANFEYIKYVLESFNLNKLNTSSAQPLITGSKVMNICLPLPPKNEQNEILNKIQETNIYSNNVIKLYYNQIQALKEYKTTLINEAVTGKIKVN